MSNSSEDMLPNSWLTVSVSDVGSSITGNTPSTKEKNNYGTYIPYIKPPQLNDCLIGSSEEFLSEKGEALARILPAGSVLVSCIGNLGRTALNTVPVAFNQQINAIMPFDGVSPKFVFYQAQSHGFRSQLEAKSTATTISIVNKRNFEKVKLNLAPLTEQHRIVAKIETLFSELDKGIESLKTARKQLKVYRQAVLKHAFEGKLTARWREDNKEKLEFAEQLLARIQQERQARHQQQMEEWKAAVKAWEEGGKEGKKPRKPKEILSASAAPEEEVSQLAELPAGWIYLRLGNFLSSIDAGKSFKCDERQPSEDEIGVAKVSAVSWGEYDEGESKTCIDLEKVNTNYFINEGDFLLSRANTIELVGACVIAKKVTQPVMLSDKTLRLTFYACYQNYFLHYLRSHQGRNEIMKRSTGNQESMRNIGQDRIRSIIVPVCGNDEVSEVINQIESKVAQIDSLSSEVGNQIIRSEILRQSILKKAFSGQLVPQDPNDEPASALLERIQAEKDAHAASQTTNKKAPAKYVRKANRKETS